MHMRGVLPADAPRNGDHPDRPPRRHGDVMPKLFCGAAAQAIPSLALEALISIVTQDLELQDMDQLWTMYHGRCRGCTLRAAIWPTMPCDTLRASSASSKPKPLM